MKWIFLLFIVFILKFCSIKPEAKITLILDSKSRTYIYGDTLKFSIQSTDKFDSIKFYLDDKIIKSPYFINHDKLGDKKLSAKLYDNHKIIEINESLRILSSLKPSLYTYKIINEYPHDKNSYTQGFEFYKTKLYESTGLKGESTLREINLLNGKTNRMLKIDKQFFAEGLTILNDSIYQLTWKAGIGFVYTLNDFKLVKSFNYDKSTEGWGLCNDSKFIYKSDGSEKIWKLDSSSQKELSFIQVTTDKTIIKKINELEWVNGKIYANTYQFQKEVVLIINPINGQVNGVIDFSGLKDKVDQIPSLNVLNGIAYNTDTKTFFITGKNWSKIFEVEIRKKNAR
ncbi:MAG: glutaminyl-peptide cyclotransferase [Flavobacteriaceae bacterium]|nr:glutaminyl-peptide cyclotransferase [Flavobacteriaceae bacterium]